MIGPEVQLHLEFHPITASLHQVTPWTDTVDHNSRIQFGESPEQIQGLIHWWRHGNRKWIHESDAVNMERRSQPGLFLSSFLLWMSWVTWQPPEFTVLAQPPGTPSHPPPSPTPSTTLPRRPTLNPVSTLPRRPTPESCFHPPGPTHLSLSSLAPMSWPNTAPDPPVSTLLAPLSWPNPAPDPRGPTLLAPPSWPHDPDPTLPGPTLPGPTLLPPPSYPHPPSPTLLAPPFGSAVPVPSPPPYINNVIALRSSPVKLRHTLMCDDHWGHMTAASHVVRHVIPCSTTPNRRCIEAASRLEFTWAEFDCEPEARRKRKIIVFIAYCLGSAQMMPWSWSQLTWFAWPNAILFEVNSMQTKVNWN